MASVYGVKLTKAAAQTAVCRLDLAAGAGISFDASPSGLSLDNATVIGQKRRGIWTGAVPLACGTVSLFFFQEAVGVVYRRGGGEAKRR